MNAEKLKAFAERLEAEQKDRLIKTGLMQGNEHTYQVTVIPGKKYTKVDVGSSGVYMVVNETGEIYGIKAYGVIHKGHQYGTLDTIDQYYWGGYRATRKEPRP